MVLSKFEELRDISDFTIRKALKQNLNYRYRKLSKVPTKTMTNDYKIRMFENIAAQIALKEKSYELIFFDEFKIASRHHNFYGWRIKQIEIHQSF